MEKLRDLNKMRHLCAECLVQVEARYDDDGKCLMYYCPRCKRDKAAEYKKFAKEMGL